MASDFRAVDQNETIWRVARTLNRRAALINARVASLPPMFFLTDPDRTPDPCAAAEILPRGAGVIYRAFGAGDALQMALALGRICRARGLTLLVGADELLAARCGADGVHLPERSLHTALRIRAKHPHWLITGAAHSARALDAGERAGLDAALVSAVFPSRSPSAKRALTPVRFAGLAAQTRLPVYALGGVKASTAPRLLNTGAAGLAAVEALAPRG